MIKRIFYFLLTNLAIMAVLSIVLKVLGVDMHAAQYGYDMNSLLIFSVVFGMAGSLMSLAMSKWTAKRFSGARVIETPENAVEIWLMQTVQRQAEKAGIGMPEVAVFDSPDVNAFATGMNRNNALVAVSTGLLNAMNQEEAEAVLGHEISHVANGDMITLALIQGVVNTFVIFLSRVVGQVVDRAVFKNEQGHGPAYFMTSLFAQLILGILATIIVMYFSRKREFRADEGGADLAGQQSMIAALEKLQAHSKQAPLPDQLAAFGIFGSTGLGLKRLFMSHPPLEERIAALREQSTISSRSI